MRYVWELYDDYFGPGRAGVLTRSAMSLIAPRLRTWDVRSSRRVHHFVANSRNVAERIRQYYRMPADVIYPPVSTSQFPLSEKDDGYYLVVSALVPYKRVDLAIHAARELGERLVIVGTGPEMRNLKALADRNVEFLGWKQDDELTKLYARCRALIFPGIEDFGIVPLEAMASGKPVVAYGAGGALETVVENPGSPTGVFFKEQTVEALKDAMRKLSLVRFDPHVIREHALRFDRSVFKENIRRYIEEKSASL